MANSRARETTEAIERLYVSMRHLFYRGFSNLRESRRKPKKPFKNNKPRNLWNNERS
jgi:hypothetical protein